MAVRAKRICGSRDFFRQLGLFEGAQRTAPPQLQRAGSVRVALPPSTNRGGKSFSTERGQSA